MNKKQVMTAGMVVVDMLWVDLPEIPRPGLTQFTNTFAERVGGHPANVAVDLAKLGMNPKELGVVASIINDTAGAMIEKELAQYDIENLLKKRDRISADDIYTGRNGIMVKHGNDRMFQIYPGANMELDAEYVKAMLHNHSPSILSVRPGYSGIDGDIASILKETSDTFVLLDLMRPRDREWSYIIPAFSYANAVHCNDTEAMSVTGTKTVEEAIDAFLSYGVELLLLTYGDEGAQLITSTVNIRQPGFAVDVIDPTGCGDAFCAGVIQKLLEWEATRDVAALSEAQLHELLRYAQAVGAACATGIGCTAGVSTERVQKILTA